MPLATTRRAGARSCRPLRLATATAILLSLGAVSSADAEIVSKLPGADGLPFAAQLVDASADGRYVLLETGAPSGTPPAAGPEVPPWEVAHWVLRDRVADSTTQLEIRVTPGGEPIGNFDALGISDDGDRVLIRSTAKPVTDFSSTGFGVYDRSEDRLLRLPTAPYSPKWFDGAWLSADGTQVLFKAVDDTGADRPIYRGPVGGVATHVTDLPAISAFRASADLQTIVYSRAARQALRPFPRSAEINALNAYTSIVVGVIVGDQQPRVLFETSRAESLPSTGACSPSTPLDVEETTTGAVRVAPGGRRVAWTEGTSGVAGTVKVRDALGGITTVASETGVTPEVPWLGDANFTTFQSVLGEYAYRRDELVAGETELITSTAPTGWGNESSYPTRYTSAVSFAGEPVTPGPPLTFTNEPIDTPNRPSKVNWATCPAAPADAPVGTFGDYVAFDIWPLWTGGRIGRVYADVAPSNTLRRLANVKTELSWFGIPYWRRTVTAPTMVDLPKPLWGIPLQLKVTAQPAAAPGQRAPAALVRTQTIFTTNTADPYLLR